MLNNVMADSEFNIQDLLLMKNAYLNIPAFPGEMNSQQRRAMEHIKITIPRNNPFKVLIYNHL